MPQPEAEAMTRGDIVEMQHTQTPFIFGLLDVGTWVVHALRSHVTVITDAYVCRCFSQVTRAVCDGWVLV